MPLGLSPIHLLLILVIALIVVGPGRLPEVGGALGKTIKEFRKAATDVQDATSLTGTTTPAPAAAPAPAAPVPAPPHSPRRRHSARSPKSISSNPMPGCGNWGRR